MVLKPILFKIQKDVKGVAGMPPWYASCLIVSSCLMVNSLLFLQEVWPRLSPGQPPPFTIDLADEAGNVRPAVVWNVKVNGKNVFQLRSGVDLVGNQEDEFVLWAEYRPLNIQEAKKDLLGIRLLKGEYKVLRDGDLVSAAATIKVESLKGVDFPFQFKIEGEVKSGLFTPKVSLESPQGEREFGLEAISAPPGGGVFQPFQPVHRILGLFPGRTWKQPFFDPLSLAMSSVLTGGTGQNGVGSVVARVLDGTEEMKWFGKPMPCHVVEYSSSDLDAKLWVGSRNGMVVRQKLTFADGMEWDITRSN